MTEEQEKALEKITGKLNMYCIHQLLWDSKRNGLKDVDIWTDLKEMFQSADYGLQMELRPIEMVWGDTEAVNDLLRKRSGKHTNKTGKTNPK